VQAEIKPVKRIRNNGNEFKKREGVSWIFIILSSQLFLKFEID